MASWCIYVNDNYLGKLVNLIDEEISSKCEVLHMDETTIQCNKEKGRKTSTKFFVYIFS